MVYAMSIKLSKIEPKPCPFCGSEASFEVNSGDSWRIICLKINCRARVVTEITFKYFPKNVFVKGNYEKTMINTKIWAYNKLIKIWNRRIK